MVLIFSTVASTAIAVALFHVIGEIKRETARLSRQDDHQEMAELA